VFTYYVQDFILLWFKFVKAASKVEVDPDAMEKLLVNRLDFINALENDIKPVCRLNVYFCSLFIRSVYKASSQ